MEVEGDESRLNAFIAELKAGRFNRFSRIDKLDVKVLDGEKGYNMFNVK